MDPSRRLFALSLVPLLLAGCGDQAPTSVEPEIVGHRHAETASLGGFEGGLPGFDLPRGRTGAPHIFAAACDIQDAVQDFRAALGPLNANTLGSTGNPIGRREINWDGVPPGSTNTNAFPGDFFNQPATGRARGVVFRTRSAGFRVSDNDFFDVNPTYGAQFESFSPVRTFAVVGEPAMTVEFFVAGTDTAAVSRGFGVVFSDVDVRGSASITVFDAKGRVLGTWFAPPCPGGFSFVGVVFRRPVARRVRIVSGQAALALDTLDMATASGPDLVVMDDFIYGEPVRALKLGEHPGRRFQTPLGDRTPDESVTRSGARPTLR